MHKIILIRFYYTITEVHVIESALTLRMSRPNGNRRCKCASLQILIVTTIHVQCWQLTCDPLPRHPGGRMSVASTVHVQQSGLQFTNPSACHCTLPLLMQSLARSWPLSVKHQAIRSWCESWLMLSCLETGYTPQCLALSCLETGYSPLCLVLLASCGFARPMVLFHGPCFSCTLLYAAINSTCTEW